MEVITTREALESIAEQWNDVLEASEARTIFLTWEWISAWLDAVYPTAPLLVIVVRDTEGDVVAIAPFYRTTMRLLGLIRYRCLRVLGDCDSGAEYPDIIVRRGFEDKAIPPVAQALLEHRELWDCLWLPNVAGWTGAYERFQALCGAGFHLHKRSREFATVELPTSYATYMQSLSRRHRSNTKRQVKHLFAEHDVELIRCETQQALPAFLAALFDFHGRHWTSVGESGNFARRPPAVRFYKRFAPVALREGWLRLFALRLDGDIRAVQYGYVFADRFYSLQEGYDPDALKGIGNILRNQVIEACIEEGICEYDFLGGYSDHKRHWSAKQRFGHDLFVGRHNPKNRLLFTKQVWPTGRYIRETARS